MASSGSFIDQASDFLASVKLALFLLFALAITAIGGTIIPQGLSSQEYLQGYGTRLYTFLSYLDMFDMYSSWWFRLLMALLVVNLVFCSIKRLPTAMKLTKPINPGKIKPEFLSKQTNSRTINLKGDPEELIARLKTVFKGRFKAPSEHSAGWGRLLYADKGAFSRFGAYIVHLSLLLFIAGGIIGSVSGFTAQLQLHDGQTTNRVFSFNPDGMLELPFSLKLNKFIVEFYDSGMPSEFRSQVTVIENGKPVRDHEIRVNNPLVYRGITFYQSSYGPDANSEMTVRFTNLNDESTLDMKLVQGRAVQLPGDTGSVTLMEFAENLMNAGRAARLLVRPAGGQEAYTEWAFEKRPDFMPPPKSGLQFTLTDYNVRYWTGLQVSRDPGVPLIWIASGVIFVGFIMAFFFAHQKLYLGVIEKKNGLQVVLAGSSHRNAGGFQVKFDQLADDIEQNSAGESK